MPQHIIPLLEEAEPLGLSAMELGLKLGARHPELNIPSDRHRAGVYVRDYIKRLRITLPMSGKGGVKDPSRYHPPVGAIKPAPVTRREATNRKSKIFWSREEMQRLAQGVASTVILEPFRFSSMQAAVMHEMHKVIPQSQWRKVTVISPALRTIIEQEISKLHDKLLRPEPAPIEMPRPVLDVPASLRSASFTQLYSAIGERKDRQAALAERLLDMVRAYMSSAISMPAAESVIPQPIRPTPPRIAVVGLLPGQEEHLRRDLSLHIQNGGVELQFISAEQALQVRNLVVDHAVCLDKISHAAWGHAKSWVREGGSCDFLHGLTSIKARIVDIVARHTLSGKP